jgi:hypothetical protein
MTRLAAAAAGLLLASCVLVGGAKVEDIYFRSGKPDKNRYYHLELAELAVEKDLDAATLEKDAVYIFELLDARYAREREAAETLIAVVHLKEEPIFRDLETLNAVTLEIRLARDRTRETEVLYLFSEETVRSLSSYAYLYTLIERAFGRIFP